MLVKRNLFLLILLLTCASPILYAIWKFGVDAPYWDQWEYVRFFKMFESGTLTLSNLFELHNEYRQLVPNVIFLLLGVITQWRVQVEMVLTVLMVAGIGWMMLSSLIKQNLMPFWIQLLLCCFVSALIFTPAQYENWLFGVQLVYFFPLFCLVLCLKITTLTLRPVYHWFLVILVAFLSTLSSVNGFLCWLALVPLLLRSTSPGGRVPLRFLLVAMGVLATAVLLYVFEYSQPGNLPTLAQTAQPPGQILHFFFRLMGNGLGNTPSCYSAYGWVFDIQGVAVTLTFFLSCMFVFHNRKEPHVQSFVMPWILLGMYGIVTAMMVTFGRSNLGLMQACAPRYIGFTVYAAIGALVVPVLLVYTGKKSYVYRILAGFSLAWMVCTILVRGLQYQSDFEMLRLYGAIQERAKCGLLLSNIVPFNKQQTLIYPSGFDKLKKKAEWLNAHDYIRPNMVQSSILNRSSMDTLPASGTFVEMLVQSDTLIAKGTIRDPELIPLRMAIVLTTQMDDGRRNIVGMDNSGNPQWSIHFPKTTNDAGGALVEAWLFDSRSGLFHLMNGKHRIEN